MIIQYGLTLAPLAFFIFIMVIVCIAAAQQECKKDERRTAERKARPVVITRPAPRVVSSEHRIMALTCTCGKLNNTTEKACWSCQASLASVQPSLHTFDASRRCSVCAYYLYDGDPITITPCCFAQGHADHLQHWVKTKKSCPSCEEKIKVAHLLRVMPPDWRPPSRTWKPTEHEVTVLVCECGKANNPAETTCWSCTKPLTKAKTETQKIKSSPSCTACGYDLEPSEQIAICPNCHCQGHKTHLLALIKAKGKCPMCGQRLRTSHLLATKPHAIHHPRR
jgi:hypothetical protein